MSISPFDAALKSGKPLEIYAVDCSECGNEWYVPKHPEFLPKFCTYCGVKFEYMERENTKTTPAE